MKPGKVGAGRVQRGVWGDSLDLWLAGKAHQVGRGHAAAAPDDGDQRLELRGRGWGKGERSNYSL